MAMKIVEGTWEQVARRADEFAGHLIRVTVLAVPTDSAAQVNQAEEAFKQHLLTSGLVSRLPTLSDAGADEDDAPIAIPGEPVSETILRERR